MLFKTVAYIEVDWRQCEQINDDYSVFDFRGLKVKRINKTTRGLFGTAIYNVPMDNSYIFQGTASIKRGGQYKELPFRPPSKGFCKFIKDDSTFYPELATVSNFPFPMPCPLQNVRKFIKLKHDKNLTNIYSQRLQSITSSSSDNDHVHW